MKPNMVSCIACTHALRRHDHSPAKTYLSVVLMLVWYFDDNCLVAHYKFNLLCLPVHCKHNSCFDEASLPLPLPLSLYPLVRIHLGSDHNCDSWQLSMIGDFECWWQILDTPSLLSEGSSGVKKNIFKENPQQNDASTTGCCSSWWTSYYSYDFLCSTSPFVLFVHLFRSSVRMYDCWFLKFFFLKTAECFFHSLPHAFSFLLRTKWSSCNK